MKTPFIKSKKGFTIIEVSLVLAIGGLIMLMVFIAWPAIQRSQRDTQRRTADLPHLISSLANYASNNSGAIPKGTASAQNLVDGNDTKSTSTGTGKWTDFYNNYVINNGTDSFADPASGPYGLNIISCASGGKVDSKPNDGLTKGTPCTNGAQVNSANVLNTTTGELAIKYEEQGAYITIVVGAYCDKGAAKAATTRTGGTRNYAVMYALESGGVFCQGS